MPCRRGAACGVGLRSGRRRRQVRELLRGESLRSCASEYSCRLDFSRTPNGKYLTIRRLSCFIDSTQPLRIIGLGRTAEAGGLTGSSISIPFVANTTGTGSYYYSINEQLEYKLPPRFYVLMSIETSAPSAKYVSCSFSGKLTNQ